MSTTFQVFIDQLLLPIRLGCTESERKDYQSASLDLLLDVKPVVELPLTLDQSICYLTVSKLALGLAASKEWDLVENYLATLAESLYQKFSNCLAVELTLSKFVVPQALKAGVSYKSRRR